MAHQADSAIVLSVVALAMLLALLRPRGWHEAWWTSGGAALLLALRVVPPRRALEVASAGRDALVFLLGLLLLSTLLERSGFFGWAALTCARRARGDGRALYRNVFVLGAVITAALSLDTTAVMLTPLVLAFVRRLDVPARPYVFACVFVANIGSLVLPMSNLTNLLFLEALHVSTGAFALRMLAPQIFALGINYGLFRLWFWRELPRYVHTEALPLPATAIAQPVFFRAASWVLALVCAGYFAAPLLHVQPFWIALAGAGVLAVVGMATARIGLSWLRDLPLGVFPFVLGLFVLVAAVEQIGLAQRAGALLLRAHPELMRGVLAAAGAAVLSNGVNNLPAALFAKGALAGERSPELLWYVLAGTNVGPCVTAFGSLATLLVLAVARQRGVDLRRRDLLSVGLVATPLLVLTAVAGMALRP